MGCFRRLSKCMCISLCVHACLSIFSCLFLYLHWTDFWCWLGFLCISASFDFSLAALFWSYKFSFFPSQYTVNVWCSSAELFLQHDLWVFCLFLFFFFCNSYPSSLQLYLHTSKYIEPTSVCWFINVTNKIYVLYVLVTGRIWLPSCSFNFHSSWDCSAKK